MKNKINEKKFVEKFLNDLPDGLRAIAKIELAAAGSEEDFYYYEKTPMSFKFGDFLCDTGLIYDLVEKNPRAWRLAFAEACQNLVDEVGVEEPAHSIEAYAREVNITDFHAVERVLKVLIDEKSKDYAAVAVVYALVEESINSLFMQAIEFEAEWGED